MKKKQPNNQYIAREIVTVPDSVMIPLYEAHRRELQVARQTAQNILDISNRMARVSIDVIMNIHAIHVFSAAPHHARTLAAFGGLRIKLDTALSRLDISLREGHDPIEHNPQFVEAVRVYTLELRRHVNHYLDTKQIEALNQLRAFVEQNTPIFDDLYAGATKFKDPGRNREEGYHLIGELAAAYKDPQRGDFSKIGVKIYQQLLAIPEAARSAAAISALEKFVNAGYIHPHNGEIADATALGQFISRARKTYTERTNLTQSNIR